ncbi:hypothetical protein WJX73_001153 [Symbiochloris irregularis]|uniref:Tyrosine specific protein phosphatases domain-containing protein n=1 Tax=Symbiochloris irregularis TaxID=706552 RepID=A0AAW1NWG6_9CHLO
MGRVRQAARTRLDNFHERHKSPEQLIRQLSSEKHLAAVNLRDVADACEGHIADGLVYRSSQFLQVEEIQHLKIESVLDLRVIQRQCKKIAADNLQSTDSDLGQSHSEEQHKSRKHHVRDVRERHHNPVLAGPRAKKCQLCSQTFSNKFHMEGHVYHANLMPMKTKLYVFMAMPTRIQLETLGGAMIGRNPQKIMGPAVTDPAIFGMIPLYSLILDKSKSGVARGLRLFANPKNYPILVHCIHGKDRTGLVIMLLLLLCDVSEADVIADYVRSEYSLKHSREQGDLHLADYLKCDDALKSDAQTMISTIDHINAVYGGPKEYCEAIGLKDSEIVDIRANLMQTPPAADAVARMMDKPKSLPTTLLHSGSVIATAVKDTFTPHVTPEYLGGLGAPGSRPSGVGADGRIPSDSELSGRDSPRDQAATEKNRRSAEWQG